MLVNIFNCCSCTILSPHSQEYVIIPRKNPRGHELPQEDKDFNRVSTSIENANQHLETCWWT